MTGFYQQSRISQGSELQYSDVALPDKLTTLLIVRLASMRLRMAGHIAGCVELRRRADGFLFVDRDCVNGSEAWG